MHWIYLSPHFDDIALSCGGLVWEQAQAGEVVSVWTICSGEPPQGPLSDFASALHQRWEAGVAAVQQRRQEDQASCRLMQATVHYLGLPDCIYRGASGRFYYDTEEGIFGPLHPEEAGLVDWLSERLSRELPANSQVVCPLALGGHVDHRLTRAAAERLGISLLYYADYPYVLQQTNQLEAMKEAGWTCCRQVISEGGLSAWCDAIAAHVSQISTFWPEWASIQAALQDYYQAYQGICLWKPSKVF